MTSQESQELSTKKCIAMHVVYVLSLNIFTPQCLIKDSSRKLF